MIGASLIAASLCALSVFAALTGLVLIRYGARQTRNTQAGLSAKMASGMMLARRNAARPGRNWAAALSLTGLTRRLDAAGWRMPGGGAGFRIAQTGTAAAAALGGALVGAPMAAAGAIAGFALPEFFLARSAETRRRILAASAPDGLDLLVMCLNAGFTLEAGLRESARALRSVCPPLADEFEMAAASLAFMPSRADALRRLGRKAGAPELQRIGAQLAQADTLGAPVAHALGALAREMRERRMERAERIAAALPPKLAVPLVIFFLPGLFVIIAGPAAIRFLSGG